MSDIFRVTHEGEFKERISSESTEAFEGAIKEDERTIHERHIISNDLSSVLSASHPFDADHSRRAASLELLDGHRTKFHEGGQGFYGDSSNPPNPASSGSVFVGGAGGRARATESSFADAILEPESSAASVIDSPAEQIHEAKISHSDFSSSLSLGNSPVLTREHDAEAAGETRKIGGMAGSALIREEGNIEIQIATGSPLDVILPEPQEAFASMVQRPRSEFYRELVDAPSSQPWYDNFSSAFTGLEESIEGTSSVEDAPTESVQGRMAHRAGRYVRALSHESRTSAIFSELSDDLLDSIDEGDSPDSVGVDSLQFGRTTIKVSTDTARTIKRVVSKKRAVAGRTAGKKVAQSVVKKTAQSSSVNSFATAVPKAATAVNRSVQIVGQSARVIAAGTRALLSALGSAAAALGIWLLPILLVIFVIVAMAMIIPTISLKADDIEISKCYEYVTQRDTELTNKIHATAKSYNVDYYHWYLNGGSVDESSIYLQTNADILIAYLDAKYENYRFEDGWTKTIVSIFNPILDGVLDDTIRISVKEEIDAVVSKLYSARYRYWSESDDDSVITHLDINVSTEDLGGFIQAHYDDVFSEEEKQKYETLLDVGIYAARNYVHNPFGDQAWYLSGRYGFYPDSSWSETRRSGIEITATSGTAVYAGISGVVGSGYNDRLGNYVTVSDSGTTVTYGHLGTRSVSTGMRIAADVKIGTVGSSGETLYPSLYIAYSRDRADGTPLAYNPLLYLSGYMQAGNGVGSGDIVSVALSQFGVRESPPGSNNVLYNTWYYGAPVSGASYPWCATFVSWCANQCGYIDAGIFPRTASSGTLQNAARLGYGGVWYPRSSGYVPVAGDIVTYRGHQHTGIVVSSDGSTVMTIEGNTSSGGSFSSDGGCVARKTWPLGWGQIDGYWHPNYPAPSA